MTRSNWVLLDTLRRAGRATAWLVWCVAAFAPGAAVLSEQVYAQGVPPPASSGEGGERRNWYNDPFFALSDAVSGCPTPLGPLMTREEADDDAHYRVERGTSCWLAHRCTRPNSYLYDADIAAAVREHLRAVPLIDHTSLWITVQRRFVYAEGCVPAGFDQEALQRLLEAIPDVEQVFVRVTSDPRGALPYKSLAAPD